MLCIIYIYFLVLLLKRMDHLILGWTSSLTMEYVKYYSLLYLAPFVESHINYKCMKYKEFQTLLLT